MWDLFGKKKRVRPDADGPPLRMRGGGNGHPSPDVSTQPAVCQGACRQHSRGGNGDGSTFEGPVAPGAVARELDSVVERHVQQIADHIVEVLLQNQAGLQEQIGSAAQEIGKSLAERVTQQGQSLEKMAIQREGLLADRLESALTRVSADHWTTFIGQVQEVCSATVQRAALRPAIEQLLAMLDRVVDERIYLAAGYRKDPELASILPCRLLFERYDDVLKSCSIELHLILSNLGVCPLAGTAGRFDPHCQRVVGTEPTSNPDLDGHVARIVAGGFTWHGSMLRPEKVVVYKLETKKP
jgi:molecular chaperone GrpE (heat shock protein)